MGVSIYIWGDCSLIGGRAQGHPVPSAPWPPPQACLCPSGTFHMSQQESLGNVSGGASSPWPASPGLCLLYSRLLIYPVGLPLPMRNRQEWTRGGISRNGPGNGPEDGHPGGLAELCLLSDPGSGVARGQGQGRCGGLPKNLPAHASEAGACCLQQAVCAQEVFQAVLLGNFTTGEPPMPNFEKDP